MEDYESARRYLATYLLEKDTSAVAHKLYGSILEKLKQNEKVRQVFIVVKFLKFSPSLGLRELQKSL